MKRITAAGVILLLLLIPLPVLAGIISKTAADSWLDERQVSVIAKNAPLCDVVRILPCNIEFEDVNPCEIHVSVNIANASLRTALNAVLHQAGMGYRASNNRNAVIAFKAKTFTYEIKADLFFRPDGVVWDRLSENLKAMVGGSGWVAVDPMAAMVIVRCPAESIPAVEEYLRTVSVRLMESGR